MTTENKKTNVPSYPCGTPMIDVVRRSIASHVADMARFIDGAPLQDNMESVTDRLDGIGEQLIDSNITDYDQLCLLINDVKRQLDWLEHDVHEWYNDNDVNIEVEFEKVENGKDKYIMDDGTTYEGYGDYINSAFLDFGYHRFHGDVNVIQCLTHFGGPAGGFWIEQDESISYWTAWWSAPVSEYLRGYNYEIVREFFEQAFDCINFEFECEDGGQHVSEYGFKGAIAVLKVSQACFDIDESSEDSEEDESSEDSE